MVADVDEVRRNLAYGRSLSEETPTFLTVDFLVPLLASAEAALDLFLKSASARFNTRITRSGEAGPELQKRYPLHELGRQIQILIPMRNVGPGLATNVRASIAADSDRLTFNTKSISVGNIRPGDFSVSFDAIVITPTEKVDGLVEVEWGEIGNIKTKSEMFELVVVGQRPDIDWATLDRCHPC